MIKRYDPNDNGPMRQFVGMYEHELGDWVKFDDVEASLNFAQQLKDEILPLLKDALEEFSDRKFNQGKYLLDKAMAKLSSI
jgi:hypothetical protein